MTAHRWEPYRPQPVEDLPLFATQGEAARDRILTAFETHKATIVAALRTEAHRLYRMTHQPISANDVRPLLAGLGYAGDPRILVSAFPAKEWQVVGHTTSNAPNNHARRICTFVPREA